MHYACPLLPGARTVAKLFLSPAATVRASLTATQVQPPSAPVTALTGTVLDTWDGLSAFLQRSRQRRRGYRSVQGWCPPCVQGPWALINHSPSLRT